MIIMPRRRPASTSFDIIASSLSLLCLVHCLALPLLFALLPTLGTWLAVPDALHLWLLILAIPMSGIGLVRGRRHHRTILPLAIGVCGLSFMVGALAWAESRDQEIMLTVIGTSIVVAAHLLNWRRAYVR